MEGEVGGGGLIIEKGSFKSTFLLQKRALVYWWNFFPN